MKITETKVTRLELTEVDRLDPIRVTLEDLGPGQGRIAFECYGTAWSVYWGAMGGDTIAEFFASVSADYIAGKVFNGDSTEIDFEAVEGKLRAEIIRMRRRRDIDAREARRMWDSTERVSYAERISDLDDSEILRDVFGDDWYVSLPHRETNAHHYCMRVIAAVQGGLKKWLESKREEVAA